MSNIAVKVYKKDFLQDNQTVLAYAATPKHKHEFWEFTYWVTGKSKNVFEKVTFNTSPGLVLFIRPNDVHENNTLSISYQHRDLYIAEEELKMLCDMIKEGLFEELQNSINPPSFNVTIKDVEFLESLINKGNIVGCTMDASVRKSAITTLLGLYITSQKTPQKTPLAVELMINAIDEVVRKMRACEPMDKIELLDIATSLNYDYPYISRLFKKHIGITLKEYYMHKKMTLATVLLTKDLSISQITSNLQYTANSHFVKAFKLYYGVTPSEWRKLHVKK